jgi:8-oxo-dGTP diphosphatase
MTGTTTQRHLSSGLRRFPWLAALVQHIWRLFQARYSVGVVGVVFNEKGQVLLVEHVFHPRHPWGLPGGWVERGESPEKTVIREFEEELSLEIEVGPVLLVDTPARHHLDVAYLCRTQDAVGALSYELLKHDWFSPVELPAMRLFHREAILRALELVEVVEYTRWHQD